VPEIARQRLGVRARRAPIVVAARTVIDHAPTSPVVVNGRVIVGTTLGKVVAIGGGS
jgi:hypothetical protein